MSAFDLLAALETPLNEKPRFFVQDPDGLSHWAEEDRQAKFRGLLREAAPTLILWPNANAGKRSRVKAMKEGIVTGVFDLSIVNGPVGPRFAAFVELKGYDSRGRAGKLSQSQIDWGNRMYRAGHHVACFFSPQRAVEWVRSIAPAAFMERAA